MCGRFALDCVLEELQAELESRNISIARRSESPGIEGNNPEDDATGSMPSFNICPTNTSPVYKGDEQLKMMRWGLVPNWTKDIKQFKTYTTFNARSENLLESKMWIPCCERKRCVVPISGYYEWKTVKREKIPYYITKRKSDEVIFLAGMYDYVKSADLYTFTIITSVAPKELAWLHERMPVILEPNTKEWDLWLDNDKTEWNQKELSECLKSKYDEEELICYQVSKDVNKNTNKGAHLVKPLFKKDLAEIKGKKKQSESIKKENSDEGHKIDTGIKEEEGGWKASSEKKPKKRKQSIADLLGRQKKSKKE